MRSKQRNIGIGVIIILIGLLLLLHNNRIIYLDRQLLWGIGVMVLGFVFVRVHQLHSHRNGVLIAGLLFLITGLFIVLDALFYFPESLMGTVFLWFVAAIFVTAYIKNNARWWAIIPGGILFIIGFIVLIDAFHLLNGDILWFIFLSGVSLIFWYVFLIRDNVNKLSWSIFPALFFTIFSFYVLSYVWENPFTTILFPISIIICGLTLLMRGIWKRK